jgi:transcriptional regulator with XRE-family HTH domain
MGGQQLEPERGSVGAMIREAREAKRLTQEALGRLLGVEKQSISNWETGKVLPKRSNAKALAAALDLPLSLLLGDNDNLSNVKFLDDRLPSGRVPLLSARQVKLLVRGEPVMASAAQTTVHVEGVSSQTFAMEVTGSDMLPEFAAGHIIVADPTLRPVDGDYVLYDQSEDGPVCLRQYRKRGEAFDLVALNPDVPTLSVTPETAPPRILAVIVEHVRTFKRHIKPILAWMTAAISLKHLVFWAAVGPDFFS